MNFADVYDFNIARLKRELRKRECEASLLEFSKDAWPQIESVPFKGGWHIECLCDHLEALANRQIYRLLLNFPPRHCKSSIVSKIFPAFVWAQNPNPDRDPALDHVAIMPESWCGPGVKFLAISYREDLALDHSAASRHLMESDWYRSRWGHRVKFLHDQNLKGNYRNTRGGQRISGIITSVTGKGGDIIIYDDPHDVLGVESDVLRADVIRFYSEQLPSRFNDPNGALIIVMQRSHSNDLAGYILSRELDAVHVELAERDEKSRWTHVCLPARFEKKHPFPIRTTVLRTGAHGEIWSDPRTKEGEAVWPEQFPLDALDLRQADLSEHAIAGQYQQRPVPRSGGMFKREWFGEKQFIESIDIPSGTQFVRHWDLAGTVSENADYTVGLKLARFPDHRFAVVDVIRVRKEGHEIRDLISKVAAQDGRYCKISLPKDPAQAGKVQAVDFVRMLAGYVVSVEPETGKKETRAEPVAAQAAHGNLLIRRAPWNEIFLEELCLFPGAPHDDQVDALSGAFARFALSQGDFSTGYVEGLN